MNAENIIPPNHERTAHRVEFFRLPQPGKRDPFFGLSRGWYYKAAACGEIKMVAIRNRGAVRGVRLVAYDSVMDYIRRSMSGALAARSSATDTPPPPSIAGLPLFGAALESEG